MKMYQNTGDQATQLARHQPQPSKLFHWYQILGFYLITSFIYSRLSRKIRNEIYN